MKSAVNAFVNVHVFREISFPLPMYFQLSFGDASLLTAAVAPSDLKLYRPYFFSLYPRSCKHCLNISLHLVQDSHQPNNLNRFDDLKNFNDLRIGNFGSELTSASAVYLLRGFTGQ